MNPSIIKHLSILSALFLSVHLFGQKQNNLLQSRTSSYNTYVYKLTDKEALSIYKEDVLLVDSSYFHTVVDSFPTGSVYNTKLLQGHYLKTFAYKNVQKYAVTTIQDFDVFIFNNHTDLCIRVYGLEGNIIDDAAVTVRSEKLSYNADLQCYRNKKSNQKGLLKVSYKGFTAYYNLARQFNNPGY